MNTFFFFCFLVFFFFLNDYRATVIQLAGEKQWKIVAPLLPANDSLLYSYVASSETLSSSMISPLHTILGGLTLTAQLLCQIASCIDIIFPKRSSMTDFGNLFFFLNCKKIRQHI